MLCNAVGSQELLFVIHPGAESLDFGLGKEALKLTRILDLVWRAGGRLTDERIRDGIVLAVVKTRD